ncbi:MAG: hypothetical protein VKJ44_04010 [Synechococcus sp.]|nr:hypothetical protein [Synechococcus sp.]
MGRRTLLLLAALLLPIGGIAALHRFQPPLLRQLVRLVGGAPRSRPSPAPPTAVPAVLPPAVSSGGSDPNLPVYVGDTKRIAAQAIDDTAGFDFERSLVPLARILAGTPAAAEGADVGSERLQLDLTQFDDLRFVEQVLALANSRQVISKTQAVDLFSDHVRRLRYAGGLVAACRLQRQRTAWADAARQRGYLLELTPDLPGARRRSLPAPAAAVPAAGAGGSDPCPTLPGRRHQSYLPITALPTALPRLRSGDLVLLLVRDPSRDAVRIGLIEPWAETAAIWLSLPGTGVVQVADLTGLAGEDPAVFGLAIFRPIANPDGRPGG